MGRRVEVRGREGGTRRGRAVAEIFRVCSSQQKQAAQEQLTWNLEPHWDDCKVGGGGAGARKGGVRKSQSCEARMFQQVG